MRKTKIISTTELYPREILRNRLTKIVIRSLTKEPFVKVNSNMSSKERQKKKGRHDQIMKNLPSNNDTFYTEEDRENNTFVLKEDKDQFINDGIIKKLEATESQ